jgi:hypothetical protein
VEGLANPGGVDTVVVPDQGPVELVLRHPEAWDGSDHRQLLLQEKLNRYLEYVVDGELLAAHPAAQGRAWTVVVECASAPDARTAAYLRHAATELRGAGGDVTVHVTG